MVTYYFDAVIVGIAFYHARPASIHTRGIGCGRRVAQPGCRFSHIPIIAAFLQENYRDITQEATIVGVEARVFRNTIGAATFMAAHAALLAHLPARRAAQLPRRRSHRTFLASFHTFGSFRTHAH